MMAVNSAVVNVVTRTSINLLKTGGALLLANVANQALKEATNETVQVLTKDVRAVRREIKLNRMEA